MADKSIVTEKMRETGSKLADQLYDAHITKALENEDEWEKFIKECDGENLDLVTQYVAGEIDSVTAIYIAMNRVSAQ